METLKKELMDVLECEDPKMIKKCYYTLALKFHPDKCGSDEDFKRIQNAYDLLTNEEKLNKELEERNIKKEQSDIEKRRKKQIKEFLDANDCDVSDDMPLEYYEAIYKDLYNKILYLLDYKWDLPWENYYHVNRYLLDTLISKLNTEKRNLYHFYDMDPFQLNIDKMYNLVFFIHIMEERLYTNENITNNFIIDLLNFFEYYMEKNPSWEILI